MQMPSYNDIEAWILKITFTSIFIGVVLIFSVKMITLLIYAFHIKSAALLAYFKSGKAATDFGGFLWNLIKNAAKGGITG